MYEELDALGAEDAAAREARAMRVLRGMGLTQEQCVGPVRALSGGWQMRVALAAAFVSPRLLLLDEPTNHLDLRGVQWLQRYLANEYRGTVLCVSHDRAFIAAFAQRVVIFQNQALTTSTPRCQTLRRRRRRRRWGASEWRRTWSGRRRTSRSRSKR